MPIMSRSRLPESRETAATRCTVWSKKSVPRTYQPPGFQPAAAVQNVLYTRLSEPITNRSRPPAIRDRAVTC